MDEEQQKGGSGVKVALGSGGAVFLIAAIFWAGATYNRVQGIENQLGQIQSQLTKFGDLQGLQERSLEHQRRLDRIEDQLRSVK